MSPPQEHDPGIASLDPMPGRVIGGNFRIEKLIGAGAMGNVYKALQLSLNKPVAVKVLHHHLLKDDRLVARFKREAKSASLLNHPNSIQIIDSGEDDDGTLYIAMELLTGRDLAQVIRDDFPLPLLRVGRIMTQVLNALDEAHAQGVIHRDLKPSNIMLIERRGEKDFVKVCDFGIAKATLGEGAEDRSAMLTVQGLVCGTPEYMSPEQARAEPLDGRSDLYAAAVILYQLVTGDIPFRAESAMGIISRHLVEPPEPPSQRRPDLNIPPLVDQIVLRGLEKNRELRFESAVAFRETLEAMIGATAGVRTPLPPSVRASMPTARDMSGSPPTPIDTATVRARNADERFGTTANLATQPAGRRHKLLVLAGAAILLAGSAAGAIVSARVRRVQLEDRAREATAAPPAAPMAAAMTPPPPAREAPPATPPPAREAPPATPPPAAEAPAANAAQPAAPRAPAREARAKHRAGAGRSPGAAAPPSPVPAGAPADAAPAAKPAAAEPAAAPAPAPARGVREVLAEAEKLLGQGEVADACARGEEAKRLAPKSPPVHKFLGKCYMRAGRTREANDNYKQYLELAPSAPDAPFVKSMIK
ncbi:MAG TPA: protein kinase [Polyangia bacterium]